MASEHEKGAREVISLCIQQLQKIPEEPMDVQDSVFVAFRALFRVVTPRFRTKNSSEISRSLGFGRFSPLRNIGGWIGSLGRSSLEVEQAVFDLDLCFRGISVTSKHVP